MATLYSWIGITDTKQILENKPNESPLGKMLLNRDYDRVILISDYRQIGSRNIKEVKQETSKLISEIENFFKGEIVLKYFPLEDPTIIADVYAITKSVLDEYPVDPFEPTDSDLNVTSGTPVMQTVWLLLSKSLNCRILSSSSQKGIVEQDFPFDLQAEFIPEAAKEKLVQAALKERNNILSEVRIEQFTDYGDLSFTSDAMLSLYKDAVKAGSHSLPVCIVGELGTEKAAIAKLIHEESEFARGPFISIDCKNDKNWRLEDDLFQSKFPDESILEKAKNGTIFLQNAEHLTSYVQRKFTDIINRKENFGLGDDSQNKEQYNFRLIVSTTKNFSELVQKDYMDEEFFFMISTVRVRVPSLEERAQDLGKIAESLLNRVNLLLSKSLGFTQKQFSPAALRFIESNTWPGNIYELYTTIKRAALSTEGKLINYDEIMDAIIVTPKQNFRDEQILNRPLGNGFDINSVLKEVRKHYAFRALEQSNDKKVEAADLMGLPNRQTLANWLKNFEDEEILNG